MKVNNKYLKNNILNNLTKNTNVYPQYITKKPSNSFLKKNISDKYIKKNISKINSNQNPIIYNYEENFNQRNTIKTNKLNDGDSFLLEFCSLTGENIFTNNSNEKNYLLTETNSSDKIKIKNLNSATIAILKENIPVSHFNDIYLEPFNLISNPSKGDLSRKYLINDDSNNNNKSVESLKKKIKENNIKCINNNYENNNRYNTIKTNKIIRNVKCKKNENNLPSSKSYNNKEKIFISKNYKKNINNNIDNKKLIIKNKLLDEQHKIFKKNSDYQKYDNKANISKLKKKILWSYNLNKENRINKSLSNNKNFSKSNGKDIEKKIRKRIINDNKNKNKNKIDINSNKIKKENKKDKEILFFSDNIINDKINKQYFNKNYCITENNIEKANSKFNEEFFKYRNYLIKNKNNKEYYTLKKENQSSRLKLDNIISMANKDENNKYQSLKNNQLTKFENNIDNNKNSEKKKNRMIINENKNSISIDALKKNKKSETKFKKSNNKINKDDIKIPNSKKYNKIVKKKIIKRSEFIDNKDIKENFDKNNFFYVNESLENGDVCNKPFVSNYIRAPFITQKINKKKEKGNNIKLGKHLKDDISFGKKENKFESEFVI